MQTITRQGTHGEALKKGVMFRVPFSSALGNMRAEGPYERLVNFRDVFLDSPEPAHSTTEAKIYRREEHRYMGKPENAARAEIVVQGGITLTPAEESTVRENAYLEARAPLRKAINSAFNVVWGSVMLAGFSNMLPIPKAIANLGHAVTAAFFAVVVTGIVLVNLTVVTILRKRDIRKLQNARAELAGENAAQGIAVQQNPAQTVGVKI